MSMAEVTGSSVPTGAAKTEPRPASSAPTPVGRRPGAVAWLVDRVPDLLATYLAWIAWFCALTAVLPFLQAPLDWLRAAIEVVSVSAPPNLATAAFLGILAGAVRRRMRAAWWFVVVYLVLDRVLSWLTVLINTTAETPVEVSVGGDLSIGCREFSESSRSRCCCSRGTGSPLACSAATGGAPSGCGSGSACWAWGLGSGC